MQTINSARISLPPSLLASLENGETVAVLNESRTVAFIVPASASIQSRPFGCAKGEFEVPDDFNDPDLEIEKLFYGEN